MKKFFAVLLVLMLAFSAVSCKGDEAGDMIENIEIASFLGSVSVGVCMTGKAGGFEKELVNSFLSLMLDNDFHIVISESDDELAMVQNFVDTGMDFCFCIGFDENNADRIIEICDEKGTYPVAYEADFGTYSFSPKAKKDADRAAEYLLKYLLGIIELGEEAPNVYAPKC